MMDYDLRVDRSTDSDSGYFSEDDIPIDEEEEVSDDYFYSHLMDDVDDDVHTSFSNDRKALSTLYKKPQNNRTQLTPIAPVSESHLQRHTVIKQQLIVSLMNFLKKNKITFYFPIRHMKVMNLVRTKRMCHNLLCLPMTFKNHLRLNTWLAHLQYPKQKVTTCLAHQADVLMLIMGFQDPWGWLG